MSFFAVNFVPVVLFINSAILAAFGHDKWAAVFFATAIIMTTLFEHKKGSGQ